MRKRTIVFLVIAVVLIGLAVAAGVNFDRKASDLERRAAISPTNIAVDLSRPGEYAGLYHHHLGHSIGLELWIELDLQGKQPWTGMDASARIGMIKVVDSSGEVLQESEFLVDPDPASGNLVTLHGLARTANRLPEGDYQIVLTVNKPIPQLAGMKQHLRGRYSLCGCLMSREGMLAMIAGIGGLMGATTILALGISAIVHRAWRRRPLSPQ